jgi:hypothetical protein
MPQSDASGIGVFPGATDPAPRPRSLGTAQTNRIIVFTYIIVALFFTVSRTDPGPVGSFAPDRDLSSPPGLPIRQRWLCFVSFRRIDTLPIRHVASFDQFRRGGSPPRRIGPLSHHPPRSTHDPPGESIGRIIKEPGGNNPPV